MILELLPESLRILYVKMQHALSIRGYLDALREILDELEWNSKTSGVFRNLLKRLNDQEKTEKKHFDDAIKWVNDQFKAIQKEKWNSDSVKKLILDGLLQELKAIEEGKRSFTSYLQGKVSLFQKTVELIASFGEFNVLQGMGDTKMLSISLPGFADPLKMPVTERQEILPFTNEGRSIIEVLKKGFVKAEVLPPTKDCKINRYFIEQGMIIIAWPDSIKKAHSGSNDDWRISLDVSVTRCLHHLFCIAAWQDWFAEDNNLHEHPSDKHLNVFYNRNSMRIYLSKILKDQNQPQVREEIKSVLDRLLIVIFQEMSENKKKKNNKERAEKYAYIKVKSILVSLSLEERKQYTIEKIVGMILDDVQHQDLTFNLKESHCKEACKRFEKNYGWPKKRGKDKKSRIKKGS